MNCFRLFVLGALFGAVQSVWPLPSQAQSNHAARTSLGINILSIQDWTTQHPFLDHMKTARLWIGHKPGQWGGTTYEEIEQAGLLDENGWPIRKPRDLRSIGTVILTGLPEQADWATGRYVLRYEGEGIIELRGRATDLRYGKNEVRFSYTPGPGSVDIRIRRTDPKKTGNYLRNITIVREDQLALHEAGQVFNPAFLARLKGFSVLRHLGWMDANDSTQSQWEDRPRVSDFTYTWRGAPVEIMIALSNELDIDPWFTLPHLATDRYMRLFAETVRDGLELDLTAYAEFSNEVWNGQFAQAIWADEMAKKRWGDKGEWVQFYAVRASQMADIWHETFGDQAADRLVRVVGTHTFWLGLEDKILNAPLWVAEGNPPPAESFDAYAITGYLYNALGSEEGAPTARAWIDESLKAAEAKADAQGLTGQTRMDFVETHRLDTAVAKLVQDMQDGSVTGKPEGSVEDYLTRVLPHHRAVAEAAGLELVAYEAGTHLVGTGALTADEALTEFFIEVNYSEGMGALYDRLLDGWEQSGGGLFTIFSDIATPSRWGSWGHLRHLKDDNPRWQAVQRALE